MKRQVAVPPVGPSQLSVPTGDRHERRKASGAIAPVAALDGGRDRPGRGGVIGGVIGSTTASSGSTVTPASSSASSAVSSCPVTPVADRVVPSVVTIAASSGNGSGTGSGEVIRSDGYI